VRLLILAAGLPCPPDHGRRIRMYQLYGPLARRHEVSWLSRNDAESDADLRQTERLFTRVSAVKIRPRRLNAPQRETRLRNLVSIFDAYWRSPFPVHDELRRALAALLGDSFDAVIVDSEGMAGYIREAKKSIPWILNTQNIPSTIARRVWQHAASTGARLRGWAKYRSALRFENEVFPRYDAVAAVSEVERRALTGRFPGLKVACVPNGVSSELARMRLPEPTNGRLLCYIGTFGYAPNRDAVAYFCSAIFPEILRHDGHVHLRLVGKGSDEFVRSLPSGLPVTGLGFVDDPFQAVSECAAVIVPLRLGGGTRIKILEAIALGKPVIATTVGAEGIDLDASSGLLIADDPSDFALRVLHALDNLEVRNSARNTGRPKVLRDYTWESASSKLANLVDSTVRARR
jgi:glycosyltransferase involved in cell wall biosynthesis